MKTKRLLYLSLLASVFFGVTHLAKADTINFGSYVGTSSSTFSNGVITFDGSDPVVAAAYAYPNPIASSGATFVTLANGGQPSVITDYTTTFTGNLADATGGTISLLADDDAIVYLNGIQIATTGSDPFDTLVTFAINPGIYADGVNTFTIDVNNVGGGPTAFAFDATAITPSISSTPEPSSLILLGTGILALAMAVRWRLAV